VRGPVKQPLAERGFQLGDLHAERRLYDVQLTRGPRHVALAGQTEEVIDLFEIHLSSPIS
jgi:hypothetical protein